MLRSPIEELIFKTEKVTAAVAVTTFIMLYSIIPLLIINYHPGFWDNVFWVIVVDI